jgi:hypothetical protein
MKTSCLFITFAIICICFYDTDGQSTLNTHELQLLNAESLSGKTSQAEGTKMSPKVITADFTASDTVIMINEVVEFTNLSTGNPTFFKWFFPGATPSVSYQENPVIIYHTPGIYDVKLIVSGLAGSDTLIRKNYMEALSQQANLPPGWNFVETTTQHPIVLTPGSNPRIFETPIENGDFLGVFFTGDDGLLQCGGAVEWNDTASVALVAQGDNSLTPGKEGFSVGETFDFRIYSVLQMREFPATPVYDPQMSFDFFLPGAVSVLEDIFAGTSIQISFSEGWSGVSSYVLPWDNLIEEIFTSHLDEVILISDGEQFYASDAGLNSLATWENKGYLVKMNSGITVDFDGYPPQDFTFEIKEGWNMLPVPVACNVEIEVLFQDHLSKIQIIKEIAGVKIFWPSHDINTLVELLPGNAYALFSTSAFTITFMPCE